MKIKEIILYELKLPLVRPFVVSFGTLNSRNILLVELVDADGFRGIGEAPVLDWPVYKAEFPATVIGVMKEVIQPSLIGKNFSSPQELDDSLKFIRGHFMAKAAVSMAAFDLYGKLQQTSVKNLLGGTRERVTFSKTLMIYESLKEMLEQAKIYDQEGIKTIKLKIKPGYDLDYIKALRELLPHSNLMVDANASYSYSQKTIDLFKRMEDYSLFCIEQPLEHNDLVDHAHLQKQISTPIALDESVESFYDIQKALELGSCKALNIKVPRVGGLTEASRIADYCLKNEIPTWTGGLIESPVSVSSNLAFATLPSCSLPADFMDPFWCVPEYEKLFSNPPMKVHQDQIEVRLDQAGLGVDLNFDRLTLKRL